MPEFEDREGYVSFQLERDTHKGISVLVRDLGYERNSFKCKFVADLQIDYLAGGPQNWINSSNAVGSQSFGTNVYKKLAQKIKLEVGSSWLIYSFKVYFTKVGSPTDSVVCKICSNNNGIPGDTLYTSTNSFSGGTGYFTFLFDDAYVSEDFFFVVERTGNLNDSNYWKLGVSGNTNNYYSYSKMKYFDSSDQWQDTNVDISMVVDISINDGRVALISLPEATAYVSTLYFGNTTNCHKRGQTFQFDRGVRIKSIRVYVKSGSPTDSVRCKICGVDGEGKPNESDLKGISLNEYTPSDPNPCRFNFEFDDVYLPAGNYCFILERTGAYGSGVWGVLQYQTNWYNDGEWYYSNTSDVWSNSTNSGHYDFEFAIYGYYECSGVVKFWNEDFSVSSDSISFMGGERKIITFENWVITNRNYFYITIEMLDWGGVDNIELKLYNDYLVKPFGDLIMSNSGIVLSGDWSYYYGAYIDSYDKEDLGLEEFVDNFLDIQVPNHCVRIERFNDFVFYGRYRVFNRNGKGLMVVDYDSNFDCDDSIQVLLPDDNTLRVVSGSIVVDLDYTGADFYEFNCDYGNNNYRKLKVWADVSSGWTDSLLFYTMRKFVSYTNTDFVNFSAGERGIQADSVSIVVSENLNFVWDSVLGKWKASLPFIADILKLDKCLLTANDIPIPQSYWSFYDESTILLSDDEYDSEAKYVFSYPIVLKADYVIDLPTSGLSSGELFLYPIVQDYMKAEVNFVEVDMEESVSFDSNGVGYLSYYSNDIVSDVSIRRISVNEDIILPFSSILDLSGNKLVITISSLREGSLFVVSYKALVPVIESDFNKIVNYYYLKGDSWELIDGFIPIYYISNGSKVLVEKAKIEIIIEDLRDVEDYVIKNVGLLILNKEEVLSKKWRE